jgi:hypothetical protein
VRTKCFHCGRDWHGLPVTVRIAQMYGAGEFDNTYTTDDSPILCEGSDFIGPVRPEPAISRTPIDTRDGLTAVVEVSVTGDSYLVLYREGREVWRSAEEPDDHFDVGSVFGFEDQP